MNMSIINLESLSGKQQTDRIIAFWMICLGPPAGTHPRSRSQAGVFSKAMGWDYDSGLDRFGSGVCAGDGHLGGTKKFFPTERNIKCSKRRVFRSPSRGMAYHQNNLEEG